MISRTIRVNKDLIDAKTKELFNQLPNQDGKILTWRNINKFIEKELPQLSHSLVNIIYQYYFEGAPFDTYFPKSKSIVDAEYRPEYGCSFCDASGDRFLYYSAEIEYCSECEDNRDHWFCYMQKGIWNYCICNLCWPLSEMGENYGNLFIRWNTVHDNHAVHVRCYSCNNNWNIAYHASYVFVDTFYPL